MTGENRRTSAPGFSVGLILSEPQEEADKGHCLVLESKAQVAGGEQ